MKSMISAMGPVCLLGASLVLSLSVRPSQAQSIPRLADPQPGQIFLTPQIDLNLQPVPLVVPEQYASAGIEGRELSLPPGFKVNVFAAGEPLVGPRLMAWSPDGVLHVANMKVRGGEWSPNVDSDSPPGEDQLYAQVLALPDADGNGVADEMRVAADRLWFPNSIQFHGDYLYVADMHQVLRLRDVDDDGFYEQREVIVPDLPTGHHRTRTIQIDRQRQKFYLSIGSSCDLCRETDERRATIMEFNLDGTDGRVFARGLRNAIGLAIHPLTGQLWGTFNGHDKEGQSLPPERIDIIRDGAFLGWPVAHGFRSWVDFSISQYRDAIFPISAQDSMDVTRVPRPVAQVEAHMAPMGIEFYRGDGLPEQYLGTAFIALRGGSNSPAPGQRVVALFAGPNGENAQVGDFLRGFQPRAGSSSGVWGKPVGLTTDARGHLYVSSDWINHLILRVSPPQPTAVEEEGDPLPADFALEQNFPNPFNGGTTIHYVLPAAGVANLVVYNLSGQRIKTLESAWRLAGNGVAHWDGRDDGGTIAASGVYVYRLESRGYATTRKLLMLR
jgi:glucose/arabinose dehydrogenase